VNNQVKFVVNVANRDLLCAYDINTSVNDLMQDLNKKYSLKITALFKAGKFYLEGKSKLKDEDINNGNSLLAIENNK